MIMEREVFRLDPTDPKHEKVLVDLVEIHNNIYPDAEFGPGHVVLADYNWDSINWCLALIQSLRAGDADNKFQKWYHDPNDAYGDDVDATEAFFLYLKEIIDIEQTCDYIPGPTKPIVINSPE